MDEFGCADPDQIALYFLIGFWWETWWLGTLWIRYSYQAISKSVTPLGDVSKASRNAVYLSVSESQWWKLYYNILNPLTLRCQPSDAVRNMQWTSDVGHSTFALITKTVEVSVGLRRHWSGIPLAPPVEHDSYHWPFLLEPQWSDVKQGSIGGGGEIWDVTPVALIESGACRTSSLTSRVLHRITSKSKLQCKVSSQTDRIRVLRSIPHGKIHGIITCVTLNHSVAINNTFMVHIDNCQVLSPCWDHPPPPEYRDFTPSLPVVDQRWQA